MTKTQIIARGMTMKLHGSHLSDPLLLRDCTISGAPWGNGGSFGSQDLISTTTFPDENLLLHSATPISGVSDNLQCKDKGSTPSDKIELETLLIVHSSSENYHELKPLPSFEYAGDALTLQDDPHLPQMGSTVNSPQSSHNHHHPYHHNNNHHHHSNSNNIINISSSNTTRNGTSTGSSIVSSPCFSSPTSVGGSPSSIFDPVSSSTTPPDSDMTELLLSTNIEEFAAFIGNMADSTTVPNIGIDLNTEPVSSTGLGTGAGLGEWTEFDSWIGAAVQDPSQISEFIQGRNAENANLLEQDATIHTSVGDQTFLDGHNSTLQNLLQSDSYSSGNNPLFHQGSNKHDFQPTSILHARLQQPVSGQMHQVMPNGGQHTSSSQLPESTTQFEIRVDPYIHGPGSRPHTTHVSPPAMVTSTQTMIGPNSKNSKSRKHQSNRNNNNPSNNSIFHHSSSHGFMSPPYGSNTNYDPSMTNGLGNQVSYASSSHIGPPWSQSHNQPHHWRKEQSKPGSKGKRKSSKLSDPSGSGIPLDPGGKEKIMHRCEICNRGFLNKSNIKVHKRTHTGEKPFKCDVCAKTFRQKAHLLKHVQIHRRNARD